jgi:23S rRNA pseudouridine955/2504/2580 synthase
MSQARTLPVAAEEADLRLDRWFRRHFPEINHGRLERLLRTGQVRVDGRRARANTRLAGGEMIRVPPLGDDEAPAPRAPQLHPPVDERTAAELRARVLHRDDELIAIDKPTGLAVQGGVKTDRHLDAMLDALRFGAAERPRLVHRLDKDTSGVLVLARSAAAAARLAEAFRERTTRKLYWAVTVGVPRLEKGRIDLALAKLPGRAGERVRPDEEGRRAVTYYRVVEHAGKQAAWLALMPETGRTHQLRVHCAAIGTPILGDGKYGGSAAFIAGAPLLRQLHLHARAIALPRGNGRTLRLVAPLPPAMRDTFAFFGFDPERDDDPFAELQG